MNKKEKNLNVTHVEEYYLHKKFFVSFLIKKKKLPFYAGIQLVNTWKLNEGCVELSLDEKLIHKILDAGAIVSVVFIFLFLLYHWDKVDIFITSIKSGLTFIFTKGAAELLRASMQNELNSAIISIEKEIPGLFDQAVKVQWLENGIEHANVNKKGIFIRITENKDADKTFLTSVSLLLNRGLLLRARIFIHDHVFESIKLVLTKKILLNSQFRSAITIFNENQYYPLTKRDKSILQDTNDLEFLDVQGLFTRVFLAECKNITNIPGIDQQGSKPKWEILQFLEFTSNLFRVLDSKGIRADF